MAERAEALARTDQQKPRPDFSHLTASEVVLLAKLRRDGLTQTEIAQRLGCNQRTVGKWLEKLTDTHDVAKAYLRGSALHMAKNIVQKGLARDHVAALKGLGVLEEQQHAGINIQINGLVLSGLGQDMAPQDVVVEAVHNYADERDAQNP